MVPVAAGFAESMRLFRAEQYPPECLPNQKNLLLKDISASWISIHN